MMNMGGPATLDQVEFFLNNLFSDREIINLGTRPPDQNIESAPADLLCILFCCVGPLQNFLAPRIVKKRTPKIAEQYRQIGGGSPIGKWTDIQGAGLTKLLDQVSPETAPHKHYIAFRYAHPLTESALEQMKADGVTRAVAFSQYPHWSCTTTGSSINHLNRTLKQKGLQDEFKWQVLDRWPLAPGFIQAVSERIMEAMPKFEGKEPPMVVFSAHGLPQYVVNRGDSYANEVAATAYAVMNSLEAQLGKRLSHMVSWQSKVGFLPWLAPSTQTTLEQLGERGQKSVLVVPIAFLQDHIETLFEIDIELAEVADKVGITTFARTEGLNDSPTLIKAQAELVAELLKSDKNHSSMQFPHQCVQCANPDICRGLPNPVHPQ